MPETQTSTPFVFYSDEISHRVEGKGETAKYFTEGHVTTGDLDLVNDIVTKRCMDDIFDQFGSRNIKLDYEHEAFRGKTEVEAEINKTRMPLAKAINRVRDDKGVKITWQYNTAWKKFDEKGNVVMTFPEVWEAIKNGYLDAYSIAYVVKEAKKITKPDGTTNRLLDQVNILNVAHTGNAVNQNATMTSVMMKSLEWLEEHETKSQKATQNIEVKDFVTRIDKIEAEVSELKNNSEKNQMTENQQNNNVSGNAQGEPQGQAPAQTGEGTQTTPAQDSSGDAAGSQPAEQKGFVEIKSLIEGMKAEFKSQIDNLVTQNKELKSKLAEVDKILEKALPKPNTNGAVAQQANNQTPPEVKSNESPLDMIY